MVAVSVVGVGDIPVGLGLVTAGGCALGCRLVGATRAGSECLRGIAESGKAVDGEKTLRGSEEK